MTIRLEHANLVVRDVDADGPLRQTAFPEFRIRGEGKTEGGRWVHVGTDDTYLALQRGPPGARGAVGPLRRHARPEPPGLRGGRRRGAARAHAGGRLPGLDLPERAPAPEARLLPRPRGQRLGVRRVPVGRSAAERNDYRFPDVP